MFEKNHFEDLHRFERLELFKNLSMNDKLNLYTDVRIVIKNMHQNDMIFTENLDDSLSNCRHNSRKY